jgi:two-component system nitrate/nitrite response regulator NarL
VTSKQQLCIALGKTYAMQMEMIAMRSSPALVAMEFPAELTLTRVDEVVRTLVELVGRESAVEALGNGTDDASEEVLVDTEIQGSRYLLVRMPKPRSGRIRLSPREQEIVRMVAKGHPNKVIADVLNISSWTVCTHLRRIFAKLGVGSRAAMVAQLLESGGLASEHHGLVGSK